MSLQSKSFQPLTTVFTYPAACFSGPWTGGGTAGITRIRQEPLGGDFSYLSTCYPPNFYRDDGSYSPGICPSGFTTAYKTVISGSITSAQCCPMNYEGFGEDGGGLGSCSSFFTAPTSIDCLYNSIGTTCSPGTVGPGVAEKFGVYILYEQKDLSLFPPGYTPGEPTLTPTTPNLSATSHSSPSEGSVVSASTASSTSSGVYGQGTTGHLTAGAEAGIGIGVALGVILSTALLFFLLARWRRRGRDEPTMLETGHNGMPELPGQEKRAPVPLGPANKPGAELENSEAGQGHGKSELDSNEKPDGVHGKTELEALEKPAETQPKPHQEASDTGIMELDSIPKGPGQGRIPQELPSPLSQSEATVTGTAELGTGRRENIRKTDRLGASARPHDLSASTSGPVSSTLEETDNTPSGAQNASETTLPMDPPGSSGGTVPDNTAPTPGTAMTIDDLELQYLENEERRIRERREAILRGRSAQ